MCECDRATSCCMLHICTIITQGEHLKNDRISIRRCRLVSLAIRKSIVYHANGRESRHLKHLSVYTVSALRHKGIKILVISLSTQGMTRGVGSPTLALSRETEVKYVTVKRDWSAVPSRALLIRAPIPTDCELRSAKV